MSFLVEIEQSDYSPGNCARPTNHFSSLFVRSYSRNPLAIASSLESARTAPGKGAKKSDKSLPNVISLTSNGIFCSTHSTASSWHAAMNSVANAAPFFFRMPMEGGAVCSSRAVKCLLHFLHSMRAIVSSVGSAHHQVIIAQRTICQPNRNTYIYGSVHKWLLLHVIQR